VNVILSDTSRQKYRNFGAFTCMYINKEKGRESILDVASIHKHPFSLSVFLFVFLFLSLHFMVLFSVLCILYC